MKRFLLVLAVVCCQIAFPDASLEKYFSYMNQLSQSPGNCREGEIEIITDQKEIAQVQKIAENRLLKLGYSPSDAVEFSRIGVVQEDQYWIWLRDAVYFPQGIVGTYDRLLWKNELTGKSPGVAVLPILPSGQIVLVLNYRHATRSWELELPRGGIEPGETQEEGALRELKEETGLLASSITFLGEIATDTGVLGSLMPVYLVKVDAQGPSGSDYSEAIAGIISITKEEIIKGFVKGFLEVSLQGRKIQVPLRDSFLTFALFQAEVRKLL